MKRLINFFLQGLVYLVPIGFTVWVFIAAFQLIDGLLQIPVPGAGVAVLVVATTLLGFLLSNYLGRRLLRSATGMLERLPLAKLLHGSVKDLMGAFVGDKRKFDAPVAVELVPGSGVRVLGFRTRSNMDGWGIPDAVAVYLPQAYNFAGQLVVVPADRLTPVTADSPDVMKLIVSGGVSGDPPASAGTSTATAPTAPPPRPPT